MSETDVRHILRSVFLRLQRDRFTLGVRELLAALDGAESDLVDGNLQALQEVTELLWCHSREESRRFNVAWNEVAATLTEPQAFERPHLRQTEAPPNPPSQPHSKPVPLPAPEPIFQKGQTAQELAALPVRAPLTFTGNRNTDLQTYFPLTRRAMAYAWRYLRRPIADGPANALDVAATVQRAACQGFYLAPVFRRRERNHANLLLLVDQGGSMTPIHRFTRDLVETAQTTSGIEHINVFYFHNAPADSLYADPHLTTPTPIEHILEQCSADTSVLLVSDAGAARGDRELKRISTTTRFLSRLKRRTALIAWLNPMPEQRWPNTSAQVIAHLIPMFPMDADGMNGAIDIVRGQPYQRER